MQKTEEIDIKKRLEDVDWDFPDYHASDLESIHPYPAKFITSIPKTLLQIINPLHNLAVLDPFCGSGTTLSVAQELGYVSYGIDINPIACLISKVKTTKVNFEITQMTDMIIEDAKKQQHIINFAIPNVDHWFQKDIQKALAALIFAINLIKDESVYNFYRLALSSIIVKVSNQESDTRYAAVDKKVDYNKTISYFRQACAKIWEAITQHNSDTQCTVFQEDTLSFASQKLPKIGIVITSPPYPNAYEYWLYHKYRMFWLGYDPKAVKEKEIGARAHFFTKKASENENFSLQMRKTLMMINSVLTPGGYVCFVVGRSKIHGEIIDNAQIIRTEANAIGYETIFQSERTIQENKKSFNLNHALIKKETLLVFRKGDNNAS